MTQPRKELDKELKAVEAATTAAVELVQNFSEQDPSDSRSCWNNPVQMLEQLNMARARAMEAWKSLERAKNNEESVADDGATDPPSLHKNTNEQDLRAQFMDMVTDAFADVLAEMKDKENIDLDILVDCLQSGMDILSQEDREFLLDNDDDDDNEDDEDKNADTITMSPHEIRRRERGFHVETTA